MQFSNDLDFEADKPIHVSIFAPVASLSQVCSDTFPTQPTSDDHYVKNPAAIELARKIYSHLFNDPVTFDSMRSLWEQLSGDYAPAHWDNTVWDSHNITFDHLVPSGDEDSEAVHLYVDAELYVTRGLSKSHRSRVNEMVKSG